MTARTAIVAAALVLAQLGATSVRGQDEDGFDYDAFLAEGDPAFAGGTESPEAVDSIVIGEPEQPAATVATPRRRVGVVIEEIIVTAQKREENVRDVPIAISSYTGDVLSALGVFDTRDLSRLVPGFNANESGRNTTLFTMRGVGFADTTYTATSTVGTYIDEVNLPYSAMTRGANLDVQRVEVVKGPQGTLYGRNTTGGLVNYIVHAPTETFEAGTNTSFSRFNTIESENYISGPLLDSLSGRLAFKVTQASEGWQISNTRPDDRLGDQDKLSARGTLQWVPSDRFRATLRLEGWRDRSDPTAPQAVGLIPGNPFLGELGVTPAVRNYPYVPRFGADPRIADWPDDPPKYPGQLRDDFRMASIKAVWNITDTMALTVVPSTLRMESDGSPQLQGLGISNTDLQTFARIRTNAIEVRLSDAWFDKGFVWSAGVNFSRDEAREIQIADTTNAGALFSIAGVPGLFGNPISDTVVLDGEPTIQQRAVFVNTDTQLTEALKLTLGARYSENDQDYTFCATEPESAQGVIGLSNVFTGLSLLAATQYQLMTGQPGRFSVVTKGDCFSLGEDGNNDPFVDELDESNISGRVALSYQTEAGSLLFGSVGRGFKAGGFPVLNPARKAQLVPVVQEKLLAYEIGAKSSYFDGLLYTGATAFYYDYTNKQLLTKTLDEIFGPLPILENAPKSTVYGFELEAQITPIEGLYIAFAGSYIKTEIDEFVGTNSEGREQDFAGLPFNFAPEWQLSALFDYTRQISTGLAAGFGADYYYSGDTNGAIDQNPLFAMDSYHLIGARLHLGSIEDTWKLTLFGRNLTNELANQGSNSFSEVVNRYVARPRTIGLNLIYRWR
jgi:iron complex outermembrane recepter protein